MKSIRIFTALILVIAVVLNDFTSVQAVQPPPSSFYGTAKWSGSNVPVGTVISAYINGVEYASTTVYLSGADTAYALAVNGDDPDTLTEIEGGVAGDTVVFYIGGTIADQTASWVSDTNVELNLTATVTYTLTVSRIGSGTVTSSPTGINCGSTCSAYFDYNTDVTLTAIASAGSTFSGWSGSGCSGTGTCTVTMDAARSVTATFTLDTYTLTVSKAGTGSGTVTSIPAGINCGVDCSGSYNYNTDVTLTATASPGSIFSGWSGSGCSGTGTCTVTMDAARSVTATFTLDTYTLTVSKSGTGSGTVTSNPAGINCGVDCSGSYNYNTDVTLTATASPGSTFSGWSGSGCSGTGTCTVTMDAARSVTAAFTLDTYTLTVSKSGTGSGTVTSIPAGINCGVDCSGSYNYNTDVTLTATASPGSTFSGWSGSGCSGTGTCTVTMDAARSVTAAFTLDTYTLTVSKSGTGSGTVTSNPAGINCGVDCSGSYNYNTDVTLTATASAGSTFSGWSGSGCSGTGTCTVTMDAARSVTATFTLNAYTLSVSRVGTGSGTVISNPAGINCGVDCSGSYNYNTDVTLTATASAGSTFSGWSGGGCSGTGTCTVTMDAARSVTATFTLNTYTLSISRVGTGSGTVTSIPAGINCGADCLGSYNYNTDVTLTATASAGSTFSGWSGGGCSGTGTCTVTMTTARSIKAAFTLNTYTITVSKTGTGGGTVTSSPAGINCGVDCSGSYNYNTDVILTAIASAGSTFSGWSGSGCSGTGTCTVTMDAARSVTATFTLDTYTLTVSKAGTGSGTVTSIPAGINCGVDCSGSYNYNTDVTLTATASPGSTFSGWSGSGCSGTDTCTVTMDAARSVTATFTLNQYTLKIVSTHGTVTKNPDKTTYTYGEVVQLIATPDVGWSFANWTGGATGSKNPVAVTMNANKTVTANYTQNQYTLTIISTHGTVKKNPDKATYTYGEVVQLTATPDAGWSFTNWMGDATGITNPVSVTMNANKMVTAKYTQDEYTLTVTSTHGTVTKNPDRATYTYGEVVQLIATPDAGWSFANWMGDETGSANPLSVTMNANKTVTANFTQGQYTLTITSAHGTVTKDPDRAIYTYGEVVQLTAIPDAGWSFANWTGGATGSANPVSVTMNSNRVVTAKYTQDEYTLTVIRAGSGVVNQNPNQPVYHYGDVVTLTAVTDANWAFAGWSGDLGGVANPTSITMEGNRTVIASFTQDRYTLTITFAHGTVTKNPDKATYTYGEVVQLTAIPDAGWSFANWMGDTTGITNPVSVTMNANKAVTANFTQNEYLLPGTVSDATNRPPLADAGGPYSGKEGKLISYRSTKSSDPDNNIVLYEWDLDNDGQFDDTTGEKPKFVAVDNGVFTVRVRVTDSGGLSSVDDATLTVRNVPPGIKSFWVDHLLRVGEKLNTVATFKDAGVNDTFSVVWEWGDGVTSATVAIGDTIYDSHFYTKAGIYRLTMTVKDKDGGVKKAHKIIFVLPEK